MQAGYPQVVSSEIGKIRESTVSAYPEDNNAARENASALRPCGVEDLRHAWKLHAREPRDPVAVRGQASHGPLGENEEL